MKPNGDDEGSATEAPSPLNERIERLIEHQARFLSLLSSRVSDSATAEDILHSAYLKALEHGHQLKNEESVVAWFNRILRNSVVDHYRRSAARSSAYDRYASERPVSYETELRGQACACVEGVIGELKPEYREAIERVDLAEQSLEQLAKVKGITANNASVRLHRARKALAGRVTEVCGVCAEHKCVNCTCRRNQL